MNRQYEVAVLIDSNEPKRIAEAINNLVNDDVLLERLRQNCLLARKVLNWQQEEKKLLAFYQSFFSH
jgi:glycosyltransferase involved in cell wall biosynthesis